jgi:NO-binding membrane sensor protein with MHYT domain
MISSRDIRQQNAERRLSRARWDAPRRGEARWLLWGAVAAGLAVWLLAVRP